MSMKKSQTFLDAVKWNLMTAHVQKLTYNMYERIKLKRKYLSFNLQNWQKKGNIMFSSYSFYF